jgi:hypothetical protein
MTFHVGDNWEFDDPIEDAPIAEIAAGIRQDAADLPGSAHTGGGN